MNVDICHQILLIQVVVYQTTYQHKEVVYTVDDILSKDDICAVSTTDLLGESAQKDIINLGKDRFLQDNSNGLWAASSDTEILAAFVKSAVQSVRTK